jgi:hypothetical protein
MATLLSNMERTHTMSNGHSPDTCPTCSRSFTGDISQRSTPSDTEQVRLREALEPHKAINFLTALEHQTRRNHEYHPNECEECSLTQTIAERLREELGLTARAALQPKAHKFRPMRFDEEHYSLLTDGEICGQVRNDAVHRQPNAETEGEQEK